MTRLILTLSVLFAVSSFLARPAAACAMYIPRSQEVIVEAKPAPTPEVAIAAPVIDVTALQRAMELIDAASIIPEAASIIPEATSPSRLAIPTSAAPSAVAQAQ